MVWVRLDDHMPFHRKIRPLSDAAFRLNVSGICWSAAHLTDGLVPTDDLASVSDVRNPRRVVAELERRGVWTPSDDGWAIHDFLVYNFSAEKVLTERAAAAERQRRAREAKSQRESQRESRRDTGVSHAAPDPTRPVVGNHPPSVPDSAVPQWAVAEVERRFRASSETIRHPPRWREAVLAQVLTEGPGPLSLVPPAFVPAPYIGDVATNLAGIAEARSALGRSGAAS